MFLVTAMTLTRQLSVVLINDFMDVFQEECVVGSSPFDPSYGLRFQQTQVHVEKWN